MIRKWKGEDSDSEDDSDDEEKGGATGPTLHATSSSSVKSLVFLLEAHTKQITMFNIKSHIYSLNNKINIYPLYYLYTTFYTKYIH